MGRIVELQKICIRRFRLIALVLAVGLPLVVVHAYSQQPVYQAEARIKLEHRDVPGPYLPNWIVPQDGRHSSEIRPRDVPADSPPGIAADGSGSYHRGPRTFFQVEPEIAAAAASRRLLEIEREIIGERNLAGIISKTGILAGRDDLRSDEKIRLVREATEVVPITLAEVDNSGHGAVHTVFAVRVNWGDPRSAARIVDAIVVGVLDRHALLRIGNGRETTAFFRHEQQRLQRQIAALEEEIARFRAENKHALPEGTRFRHDELARLGEAELDLSRSLLDLEQERLSIQRQLDGLAHLGANGDETTAEDAILRNRLKSLSSQIKLLDKRKSELTKSRSALIESLERTPAIENALDNLERRLLQKKEMLDAIARRAVEGGARLNLDQRAARFEVIQFASVPQGLLAYDRHSILVLGTIFVFAFAIGLAVVIDRARPRVRSAAEVERLLGVRPLVSLPHVPRRPARRRGWSSRETAAA